MRSGCTLKYIDIVTQQVMQYFTVLCMSVCNICICRVVCMYVYMYVCMYCVCNITYLLTPWRRVLLEKLTGLQLVKKLPAFHGARRFITTLTIVRHLSLSWASPIQSIYTHPTSWRSVLILSAHLRLGLSNGLLPPVSPP